LRGIPKGNEKALFELFFTLGAGMMLITGYYFSASSGHVLRMWRLCSSG
jgi:hypothetical protein